jgi:hypothetical protein
MPPAIERGSLANSEINNCMADKSIFGEFETK